MTKLNLTQKRLEIIRKQLQGGTLSKKPNQDIKNEQVLPIIHRNELSSHSKKQGMEVLSGHNQKDGVNYLKKDLLKVFFLSSLIISIQLALYLSLKNNLIRLPF